MAWRFTSLAPQLMLVRGSDHFPLMLTSQRPSQSQKEFCEHGEMITQLDGASGKCSRWANTFDSWQLQPFP